MIIIYNGKHHIADISKKYSISHIFDCWGVLKVTTITKNIEETKDMHLPFCESRSILPTFYIWRPQIIYTVGTQRINKI